MNYAVHSEAADAVVRKIEAGGGKAFAVQADVAQEDQVLAMFAAIDAKAVVSTMPDFALKLITPIAGAVPSKSCTVVDTSVASTTRMLSMKYAEPFGPDSPSPK